MERYGFKVGVVIFMLLAFSGAVFAQAPDIYVTRGAAVTIKATDVDENLKRFDTKVQAYGLLEENKKAAMRVVTKVSSKTPKDAIITEWKKNVKLYDKKSYKKIQKGPELIIHPIANKEIKSINVVLKKNTGKETVPLSNKVYVAAPVVTGLSGDHVDVEDSFVVEGVYFGMKTPKIMIEYQKKGRWKYKRCKVDKVSSLRYQNAQGKDNKSCMKILSSDPADDQPAGYSRVTVKYPKLRPEDAQSGYLIIENSFGINAFKMLSITSTSFSAGGDIPVKHANFNIHGGENISPALAWSDPPENVKSFVVTCVDLYRKADEWVHWMVVDIPPEVLTLEEGASGTDMPEGAVEMRNAFSAYGYGGPQPQTNALHQYIFTVYALNVASLELNHDLTYTNGELLDAMKGHVIEKAAIVGQFKRGY